jgi:hypothetical protein
MRMRELAAQAGGRGADCTYGRKWGDCTDVCAAAGGENAASECIISARQTVSSRCAPERAGEMAANSIHL